MVDPWAATVVLHPSKMSPVLLAAVNAVFNAWTTAMETRHPAALAHALGVTPAQITAGLSAAQLLPALNSRRSH